MMKSFSSIKALLLGAVLLAGPAAAQETVTGAVCVDTSLGEFCMRLLREDAPRTVENFLNYVNRGDYDETLIHRSEPNFVIQGGGFSSNPLGEAIHQDPPVVNEFGRSNTRGTVAMAKLSGDPDSATNEWFVNTGDNLGLDIQNGGFTVFAEIITGMDVVDDINDSQRADLSSSLGGAFTAVPVLRKDAEGVGIEDLVVVNRVYVSDVVVEEEEEEVPGEEVPEEHPEFEAVSKLESGFFKAPVQVVGGGVMSMIFTLESTPPAYVFEVDIGNIILLDNPPAVTAVMDIDAGTFSLPSIRANGKVYTNLEFRLSDRSILQFTLESYEKL